MRLWRVGVLTAALGMGVAGAALADDPSGVQAPIQGAGVMGDKGRSGPDGWVQAPVTRDQSPTGKAAGETGSAVAATPNARPGTGAPTLPPGQDPATPATPQSVAPGK